MEDTEVEIELADLDSHQKTGEDTIGEDFGGDGTSADSGLEDEPELPIPTTFEEILQPGSLLDAVKKLGFTKPTDVQARTVPIAMRGGDMIVQAKTGSGKTLAFVLPMLQRLSEAETKGKITTTFGIAVVPTRELAVQVVEVVKSLTGDVFPACLIGGMDMQQQYKDLEKDPRIIVGTPGRILDFLRQKAIRLNNCRFFVLDEVDEMLSIGFIDDVRTILSRLPDRRQGLFLSATLTPRVDMLAHSFLSHPDHVVLNADGEEQPSIEQWFYEIGGELMAKPAALCDLIETLRPASAIIFCNTKSDTQLVEVWLRRRGFEARRLNSDLSQSQRNRVMKKIRAGQIQFLVATDIAARGIDIAQIDLVINYAIHEQPEIYVHRTGRTGRAGRHGRAISLVGPRDFSSFHFVTKVLDRNFEKKVLPTDIEVADARAAHFYELIRQQGIEVKDRDLLAARRIILELGGIDTPTDELIELVGKLCRVTIERSVQEEAKSLDEELDAPPPEPKRARSREEGREPRKRRERGDRGESGGRDRTEQGDRAGNFDADERRSRDHGERERAPRERNNRPESRQPQERAIQDEGARERVSESNYSQDSRPRRDRRVDSNEDVRVYVGQGTAHGMTAEVFLELAREFAEIPTETLRNISIREHYGFVDLPARQVETIIENLNGIEYNGQPLPVEIALIPTRPERRRDNRGGDYRGRDDGRGRDRRSR